MLKILILLFPVMLIVGVLYFNSSQKPKLDNLIQTPDKVIASIFPTVTHAPTDYPSQKILQNNYHVFQTFNNCGPASLSMALSYYGIKKTQAELGQRLRPYQIVGGNNDDKSVLLGEMAAEAETYGLIAYHRPNGNMELIKQFIANDIPVIARTWLHKDEDIGHFRVVKGYDETRQQIIQDDSFENKNLRYSYADFNEIWEKFNFEYLVLVPTDKQAIAEDILGEDLDEKTAWRNAVELSLNQLQKDPDNIDARFNLSVAYFNIGEYQKSVVEYEKVANKLSFRTLWYQLEPIEAYYELDNYQKVFEVTDRILNNGNRAYSEAYMLRGNSYLKMGQKDLAKAEFDKAVLYNFNFSSKIPVVN